MRCSYFYLPCDPSDPDDVYVSCKADAGFNSCNGPVCEEHRCRCARSLTPAQLAELERP